MTGLENSLGFPLIRAASAGLCPEAPNRPRHGLVCFVGVGVESPSISCDSLGCILSSIVLSALRSSSFVFLTHACMENHGFSHYDVFPQMPGTVLGALSESLCFIGKMLCYLAEPAGKKKCSRLN